MRSLLAGVASSDRLALGASRPIVPLLVVVLGLVVR
jgi:hypothetical protein